eukprot:CAMPEP_0184857830 /NCGR_PEP_ID=MMETSP0580-20130426/2983_1 /TAXON_ID=1118495 /ORGANISM="Dactyliosolen fragilissimus" /LENGTH=497 /DNA_ID=CAMNT_0027353661 /DNA_START=43 /DNA_END=1536 /DNA_ORIENTATION=-
MVSEAQLVIKLIRYAPNGYVPLHQLRKMYHDKYGIHLKKRKKISKWIGSLPGVYINNKPAENSIHTRHKQDEAEDEANLVIKLIREAQNGYVPLEHLRQMYHDKYRKHLEQKKLLKWIQTLPNVYIDNNPVTLSIFFRAVSRGLTTPYTPLPKKIGAAEEDQSIKRSYAPVVEGRAYEQAPFDVTLSKKKKKKKNKKMNDKKAKGSNPSDNLPTPKPQKQEEKKKRHKAKVKSSHNLPICNKFYYGMANQGGRKCMMNFGSTSGCQTKSKYWPSEETKRHYRISKCRISRPIVSGYIANKIKKAGGRKAARKTRNLARLQKKYNPMPAVPSSHAMQRYKERGFASTPIYKPMKGGNEAIVVTYVPIQREVYSDAKKSRLSIQVEVDRMSQLSKKSDLPKSKLSSRDAYMFKLSSQAVKKEECRRRSQQKQKAYLKQCSYLLAGSWTPLSIKTGAPRNLYIHNRRKRNSHRYKSAARLSRKKAQKGSKKKNRTARRSK